MSHGRVLARALERMEHVDVLIVGAGLSGIGAAHHVQAKAPWARTLVLEARDAIGGTWDLFRYPGIRSDSDMFTLGYPFRPWDDERAIADGASIRRYIEETAEASGITPHIRFGHRVIAAAWRSDEARWHVTVERTDTGDRYGLTCGFLFGCTGYYRYDHGYEPDFPGIEQYEGTLVHPQHWPEDLDCTGRRVIVIGSGATAITLVPALAGTAAHVTMLQRSPTWVIALPARARFARLARWLPERLRGPTLRWTLALVSQLFYGLSKRRPELVKRMIRRGLERELPAGYDIDTHFTPHYDPWDQRLCIAADGDLFGAIREGSASVVTDHVDTFTAKGIRLKSGHVLEADVVVTATGLDLLFLGGIALSVDGEPIDVGKRLTYKGMMLDGVPNLAFAIGYTNASWTLRADLICDYVTRLLNEMRASGMRQCTPIAPAGVRASGEPILGLHAGYILRAIDRLPKQGGRFPWQVRQSYVHDHRAMRRSPLRDGAMRFSRPESTEAPPGHGGLRET